VIGDQVVAKAHPRAALIGNPSDGYHGKTIAFVFDNFSAEVIIRPSDQMRIIEDSTSFDDVGHLLEHIETHGFYGAKRLILAGLKTFYRYGSSAIITALFLALSEYHGIVIKKERQAQLVLDAERVELGIDAGLQDRVAQSYGCPMMMDFDKEMMNAKGHGTYTAIEANSLPPCYIAYSKSAAESSSVAHKSLRTRFDEEEKSVQDAMKNFARLTDEFVEAMEQKDHAKMNNLVDTNFDLRASILDIPTRQLELITTAREQGVSAKFTGSGGAIIGF